MRVSDLIEIYEERAAIREFDGEMRRDLAEEAAYYDWRKLVGPDVIAPQAIRVKVKKFDAIRSI